MSRESLKVTFPTLTSPSLSWDSGGTLCLARGQGLAVMRGGGHQECAPEGGCTLAVGSHAATPSVCSLHTCPRPATDCYAATAVPPRAFLKGKAIDFKGLCPFLCPPRLQRTLPKAQTLTFLKPELLSPGRLDLSPATPWVLGIGRDTRQNQSRFCDPGSRVVGPGCACLLLYSLTEESILSQAVRARRGPEVTRVSARSTCRFLWHCGRALPSGLGAPGPGEGDLMACGAHSAPTVSVGPVVRCGPCGTVALPGRTTGARPVHGV